MRCVARFMSIGRSIERRKAQRRVLRSVLARFFGDSAEDLVLRLIEDERITPEQLDELRRGTPPASRRKGGSGTSEEKSKRRGGRS